MENKQDLSIQIPDWIEIWSRNLLQWSSTSFQNTDLALDLIQHILLGTTRGESCISVTGQDVQLLQQLAINDQQAQSDVAPFVYDQHFIYLYRYWQLEQRLSLQVQRIQSQAIADVDTEQFSQLLADPQQKNALNMVAHQALSIITGGPGTGKTYTLARIIAVLNDALPGLRIAMAAPTGKAAQRMKEALQHSFNDEKLNELGLMDDALKRQETLTIHRLLGLGHQSAARFNAQQPLPFDVVVIDEASMLDLHLATLLFEAIPDDCRLILLGDAQQLASVDVGSVLADLQSVQFLQQNRVHLITSRRFKEGALIGRMAQFIQAQQQPCVDTDLLLADFELQVLPATTFDALALSPNMADVIQLEYLNTQITDVDLAHYYQKLSCGFAAYFDCVGEYAAHDEPMQMLHILIAAFDQYRILTPIHYGALGLTALNRAMEAALFKQQVGLVKQGDWYLGRPIMITHNDYQLGLSNGDIGICLYHRTQPQQYEVYFPSLDLWVIATRLPKSIQTAFAMTIHKSQGSEFKHVAVVFDAAANRLLSQELLYTAITRAKSAVSLLVDRNTFARSLSIKTSRESGLVEKIQALFELEMRN